MSDIIQLLPDSIANQIAAGEVIQRPSSVVKELIENSIDAGASEIVLVIKEAGKVLIQVSDNGIGMSETDARMCFERHATSKIQSANDIFKIRTKGFRGEALASIAAIAHVELITRQEQKDIGTKVVLIGSKFKSQTASQTEKGTKISVKNLFFNVPARRKFLKSDSVELKHINDEFIRLALAHTDISFSFYHNGKELYRLVKSSLKSRILGLFGRGYESKILPIAEEMEVLKVDGFIGKLDACRKSRTNQFIFVNNRFIKSSYLNHAIFSSYEEYIEKGQYPIYFIFLDIDPDKIDINIHPTKQEIKFEDERLIYSYLRVAIKHVIGKFTYKPSLDFESESTLDTLVERPKRKTEGSRSFDFVSSKIKPNKNRDEWEKAFEIVENKGVSGRDSDVQELPSRLNIKMGRTLEDSTIMEGKVFQLHNAYILKEVKSGFILIDQKNAHERVLFEEYMDDYNFGKNSNRERLLFPQLIEVDKSKIDFIDSVFKELEKFGFKLELDIENNVCIKEIPINVIDKKGVFQVLQEIIENSNSTLELESYFKEDFAKRLAKVNARKKGESLTEEEMKYLIDKLFNCSNPYNTPGGKKCFVKIEMDEIINRFS